MPASELKLSRRRSRGGPRLSPGRQLGLLWGGVAVALIAFSPFAPRFTSVLPACPLKAMTGVPCPSCGVTRAALHLSQFEIVEAFVLYPLAALAWSSLIVGGLIAGGAALLGYGVPAGPRQLPAWARWGIVAAFLANWAYLIATGV